MAKFMMTKTMLRKDIDISPDKNYKEIYKRGEKITSLFISGIPIEIRKEFKRNNFCPFVINSYLKGQDMTFEIVNKLIQNFRSSMQDVISEIQDFINSDQDQDIYDRNYIEDLRRFTRLFIKYVLTYNPELYENEDKYFNFIIELLIYWTGSSMYMKDEKYIIKINRNSGNNAYPNPHTCNFSFEIPNYTGTDEEIGKRMFDKINDGMERTGHDFGIAGGGMRKRRTRKIK
jgi:hypothetical protein